MSPNYGFVKFETLFICKCRDGNLQLAQKLFANTLLPNATPPYTYVVDNPPTFCSNFLELAFQDACENGHMHVAKWLYYNVKIKNLRVNIIKGKAFLAACSGSYFKLAKWLYEISDLSYKNIENSFNLACVCGNLKFAVWLLSLKLTKPIRIANNNHFPFKAACKYNKYKVALWLSGLNPFKYLVVVKNSSILWSNVNNNYEETLLQILYILKHKGYKNFITPLFANNVKHIINKKHLYYQIQ